MAATACDSGSTRVVPPAERALVIVELEQQEAFFRAVEAFASSHQFKYEKQYLAFKTRPFTEIVLSRDDGDRILIHNHFKDEEFEVAFFVFNPNTDLAKLKADFVTAMSQVVGANNVQ